jgi:hypothetical protein
MQEQTLEQGKRERFHPVTGWPRDSEVGETTVQVLAGEVRMRRQKKTMDRESQERWRMTLTRRTHSSSGS